MNSDTIAAIATSAGMGGIGIIRISGSDSMRILGDIFRPAGGKPMQNRYLTYGKVMDGDETVDACMAVIMRAPASYTREDVAEIQTHGGPFVMHRVLQLCLSRGARLAEPGEFTRRAFENGRIDLSQAEGVMRLIAARGEEEYRAAVRQMEGGAAAFVRKAADALYQLQAGLAACIDYPEEISDEEGAGELREGLEKLIRWLEESVDEHGARLVNEGVQVTLYGAPNAGKSSLLNALSGRERAIVTDIPGTTRDIIEDEIVLDGFRIRLTDTAGLRETGDPIEKIGVERSKAAMRNADLALLVLDGSREVTEAEKEQIRQLDDRAIAVINKSDLEDVLREADVRKMNPDVRCITVSAMEEESLKPLKNMIRSMVAGVKSLSLTQPRHLDAIRRAIAHLEDAKRTLETWSPDMAATDLEAAQAALGEITGDRVDEKLLDTVFSSFCVGK